MDDTVWDTLYQTALDMSESPDILEGMPRRCGRQTTGTKHPANTPKQSLYYRFIDHMIMELETRLIKSENRVHAQCLLPRCLNNLTD